MIAGNPAAVFAKSKKDQRSQITLLDYHVLANNQPARSHFAQLRQHASDVFFEVHENENNRQVSSGFYQTRGVNLISAVESSHRMEDAGARYILVPQVAQNFQVQ